MSVSSGGATPPPEAHRSLIASLVAQLLGYMDRPWRVVAAIAVMIVGGAGWAAWEEREAILEAWLTPAAEIKIAEVPDALVKLVSETGADLVQIWAADLTSNSQRFIAARRHDGERPAIPAPRRLPIIVTVSDVGKLIDVIEGHAVCVDLTPAGTPLAQRLADHGMRRGCAIPIPPTRQNFVGVIYLGWRTPPNHVNENVAIGVARDIARSLAVH